MRGAGRRQINFVARFGARARARPAITWANLWKPRVSERRSGPSFRRVARGAHDRGRCAITAPCHKHGTSHRTLCRELINRVRLSARRVRTPSRRIDLIYGKRRIGLPSNYRPVLAAFEYFREPIAATSRSTMMTDDRALNQRLTTSRYRVTAHQRDVLCKSRGNRGHEPAITSLLRGLIRGD